MSFSAPQAPGAGGCLWAGAGRRSAAARRVRHACMLAKADSSVWAPHLMLHAPRPRCMRARVRKHMCVREGMYMQCMRVCSVRACSKLACTSKSHELSPHSVSWVGSRPVLGRMSSRGMLAVRCPSTCCWAGLPPLPACLVQQQQHVVQPPLLLAARPPQPSPHHLLPLAQTNTAASRRPPIQPEITCIQVGGE